MVVCGCIHHNFSGLQPTNDCTAGSNCFAQCTIHRLNKYCTSRPNNNRTVTRRKSVVVSLAVSVCLEFVFPFVKVGGRQGATHFQHMCNTSTQDGSNIIDHPRTRRDADGASMKAIMRSVAFGDGRCVLQFFLEYRFLQCVKVALNENTTRQSQSQSQSQFQSLATPMPNAKCQMPNAKAVPFSFCHGLLLPHGLHMYSMVLLYCLCNIQY